jgi:hypothetical protein
MIRVIVEKVNVASGFAGVTQTMVNVAAEGLADVMRKNGLEKKQCSNHPLHTSTIVVKALDNQRESLRVEKRSFCCQEFQDSIQIEIKR